MAEPKNTAELVRKLQALGVPDHRYTIGGFGAGEVDGIEQVNGVWCTYYSERGMRNDLKRWRSEEEACAEIYRTVVATARALGEIT